MRIRFAVLFLTIEGGTAHSAGTGEDAQPSPRKSQGRESSYPG